MSLCSVHITVRRLRRGVELKRLLYLRGSPACEVVGLHWGGLYRMPKHIGVRDTNQSTLRIISSRTKEKM